MILVPARKKVILLHKKTIKFFFQKGYEMADIHQKFCHETGGNSQNVRCLPATLGGEQSSKKNSTQQACYPSAVTVEEKRIKNEGTFSIILRLCKEIVLFQLYQTFNLLTKRTKSTRRMTTRLLQHFVCQRTKVQFLIKILS